MHLESVPPFLCWSVKYCYKKGCSLAMYLALLSSTGVVMKAITVILVSFAPPPYM